MRKLLVKDFGELAWVCQTSTQDAKPVDDDLYHRPSVEPILDSAELRRDGVHRQSWAMLLLQGTNPQMNLTS